MHSFLVAELHANLDGDDRMETTGASKRTADSDLSADTYAVCTNCSRLSLNLQNCDKCGSALSAENSVGCYSSEPKRARTDAEAPSPSPSNENIVNGNGPSSNAPSPDTSGPVPVPVPQALYKNKNATGPEDVASIRPQALFTNLSTTAATNLPTVITSALPTLLPATVGGSGSSVPVTPPQMASMNSMLAATRPGLPQVPGLDPSLMTASAPLPAVLAQNRLSLSASMQGSAAAPRVSVPSYNLQPPAPPQYPLSSVQRPVESSSGLGPPNQVAPPSTNGTNSSNPHKLTVEPNCVSIPAQQIRIGAQKFKPITAVSFKDDGILFTLKDYTYAPVLLNARAILRCRANMNLLQYPVFLLYLEASCMKQIRNIFGLSEEEFADSSPCELKRCISIFPAVSYESAQDVIRLKVTNELHHMFSLMEKRYMRYNKILEEMTPEEGLDLILSQLTAKTPAVTNSVATINARPDRGRLPGGGPATVAPPRPAQQPRPTPPPLQHTNMNAHRAAPANQLPGYPNPMANNYSRPGAVNSVPPRNMPPISTGSTHQPVFRATNPAGPRGPPTLQIPTDTARWQELQKSLVQGGVYHVQQPGANRKTMYCLWNGTQLVPYNFGLHNMYGYNLEMKPYLVPEKSKSAGLVQNTEVQLDCEQVWVGSFRAKSLSHLRVKADTNPGLFVSIDKDNRAFGRKDVHFLLSDIIQCQLCIDQRMSCMFLDLNDVGAEKIRRQLGIHANSDPAYNTRATEERRKHLILFLKNVNNDQWEALSSMKFPGRKTNMFMKIDVLKALKILADIKSNSRVQAKITDWINKKSLPPNLIAVENIAKELSNPDDKPPPVVDDDDDVIMTQEEVGVKCPYTQQVMKEPVKNKICGHNYEKSAINEFILRKKGNAKCPYAGCGNAVPLKMSDMEDNYQLKEYIKKNVK